MECGSPGVVNVFISSIIFMINLTRKHVISF
jgi:hypothetical protein